MRLLNQGINQRCNILRVLVLFTLLSNSLISTAQNNDWNLRTFFYSDEPMTLGLVFTNPIDDAIETNITPIRNKGLQFAIEKNFSFGNKIGFLFGGSFGGFANSFEFEEIFTGNTLKFEATVIRYLGVYTGLSFNHHFSDRLYMRAILRVGAISLLYKFRSSKPLGNELGGPLFNEPGYFSTWSHAYEVNPDQKPYFILEPELSLGYKFKKIPFCISLGAGILYSPSSLIHGEFTYSVQVDFIHQTIRTDFTDSLSAYGITLKLHYFMK